MASDAYIQAAKLANRQPTTYMSVESAEGETLYYTTQGQWQGSDTLTNVDTVEEVGRVTNERFKQSVTLSSGAQFPSTIYGNEISYVQEFTAGYDQFLNYINHTISWSTPAEGPSIKIRVKATNTDPLISTPTITHYSDEVEVSADYAFEAFSFHSSPLDITSIDLDINNGETWYISVEFFRTFQSEGFFGWVLAPSRIFGFDPVPLVFDTYTVKPTSQVITSAIDFGADTLSNPIFSVDDITEAGSLIAYSYSYSPDGDGVTYTSGGTIVDGSSLVASRYFKIQADWTTSTGGRGKIREIQLKEGIFRYFGSHIDTPFNGVSPQIIPNSVSTLSQKIQIGRGLSTTGESSVRMFWVQEVSDMIASGYLKGKDVAIYSGFVGLPTDAYEPILVGTWYDHDLDEINRVITVKIRDAFKQFEKRKIPEEVVNPSTGAITTPALTFTTTSLVTVMKQIFDEIGLRDRYISPDFNTLEAGDYAAEKYKVSRELVQFGIPSVGKPTDFNKLLDELAVTGSMYLVPQGNGQIKPKPFDPNQEHTATLDANEIDFVNLKGNISEFFSRFYAYYNPKTTLTADPTDDTDDYDNGTAVIDATAEVNWFPERGTKQHFDKWKVGRTAAATPLTAPPQALTDLMGLWNSLFTEPLYTVSAKKIPPRFANIEPADVIAVDNLDLPVVDNAWDGGTVYNSKFKDISAEVVFLYSAFISFDGFNAYAVDITTATIYQYTMSVKDDITTASYSGNSIDVSSESTTPIGLAISPDGLSLFVIDSTDIVYQYSLSLRWDISTATYTTKNKSVVSETTASTDLRFNKLGSKMYISASNEVIYQYSLSTVFDVSTATYDSKSKDVSAQVTTLTGMFISDDGDRAFVVDEQIDTVFQYELSVSDDISTASYGGVSFLITEDTSPVSVAFSGDGLSMYIAGQSGTQLLQYDLSVPFKLGTVDYTEGDRVIHDGFMWRARQDNTGKDPTSEAAFWQNTDISDAGLTVGKHFFVLGRKFNPNQATMELELMEMPPGTLGGFDSGFSSGFNL